MSSGARGDRHSAERCAGNGQKNDVKIALQLLAGVAVGVEEPVVRIEREAGVVALDGSGERDVLLGSREVVQEGRLGRRAVVQA